QNITHHDDVFRKAIVTKTLSLATAKPIKTMGLTHIRQGHNQYAEVPDFTDYSIAAVIIVAVVEEFLFRGFMITIALSLTNRSAMVLVILATLLLFAFSHVSSSLNEFKCKLPLSIFTTIGFIVTGTLLSAIITHVILNIYAYLQTKATVG